jgi:hypothetical protein
MKMQRAVGALGMIGMTFGALNCGESESPTPATCAEAKDATGAIVDGPQTLFHDNDPAKHWPAYCHNMATENPKEYLSLKEIGSDGNAANYSKFIEYVAGDRADPSHFVVTTKYDRVRIDPIDLTIDIADNTFTRRSAGGVPDRVPQVSRVFDKEVASVPFGVAMQCGRDTGRDEQPKLDARGDDRARANVDLSGLPFRLVTGDYCAQPFLGEAVASASSEYSIVNLSATGISEGNQLVCGRASIDCLPDPAINNITPANRTIQLAYVSQEP